MAFRTKDALYEMYYEWHKGGMTLSEVAHEASLKRATIQDGFRRRGFVIQARKLLDEQKLGFFKFTPRIDGYWQCTTGRPRQLMHRFVWRKYRGEIPEGFEIHHKDGDRSNNRISNLECISADEHRSIHKVW